ncbi:MAG: hypothetical protein C9356_19795 [Oleiphilus sp.]|nr:MAG: hypothetical protein C9356_19795 [Oleiphilus sp.]
MIIDKYGYKESDFITYVIGGSVIGLLPLFLFIVITGKQNLFFQVLYISVWISILVLNNFFIPTKQRLLDKEKGCIESKD